jgi:mannosyltransferase
LNPSRQSKLTLIVAAICAALGALLPVTATAVMLSPDAIRRPSVITGIWLFKALLVLHAILFAVVPRLIQHAPKAAAARAEPARRGSAADRAILIALLILAAALRLYKLDQGLWHDEMLTLVKYARLPFLQIISTFDSQNQHMLYSVLSKLSFVAFGETVWSLRLPAALLGVASVAAMYFFALEVASRREAIVSAALLSVSYHHVWFSQNARGYTGLLLWTLLATMFWARMLSGREQGFRIAALYGLTVALGVFTHITGAIVAVAHLLIWAGTLAFDRKRDRIPIATPLAGLTLATTFSLQLYALSLPQVVSVLTHPAPAGPEIVWKSPLWLAIETMNGLADGIPGGWVSILIGGAIATAGIISFARQDLRLTAAMLLPGGLLISGLIATSHNLWPRFLFFVAGFAVLLLIRGVVASAQMLSARRGQALAVAPLVLLILLSAAQVPRAWHPKQDYDSARAYIESHRDPRDAVVTLDMSDYGFNVYGHAHYLSAKQPEELIQIERSHRRTWVVYTFPIRLAAQQPELWRRLNTEYKPVAEFPGTVAGGTIFVKVQP